MSKTQVLNATSKYFPDIGAAVILNLASTSSTAVDLIEILDGEVWGVDVTALVRQSTAATSTVSGWKLAGIFVGTAGPTANLSGSVLSSSYGAGAALLTTAPTLVVAGQSVQFKFTNPNPGSIAWTVGYEWRIAKLVF